MTLNHQTLPRFWKYYDALPEDVRRLADRQFERLKADPYHPSLHFVVPAGALLALTVAVTTVDAVMGLAGSREVFPAHAAGGAAGGVSDCRERVAAVDYVTFPT